MIGSCPYLSAHGGIELAVKESSMNWQNRTPRRVQVRLLIGKWRYLRETRSRVAGASAGRKAPVHGYCSCSGLRLDVTLRSHSYSEVYEHVVHGSRRNTILRPGRRK